MFRDLKEYHEIAKIYTDKDSKLENLDENRNTRGQELAAKRLADKPEIKSREEVGLRPKVKSFADRRAARTGYKKPEKKLPTTAEIRAKAGKDAVSNIPKAEGSAVIDGKKINPDFGKKVEIKKEPVKKMNPIEKKNRERLGDARVDALKKKNAEFQAAKKSGNLAQFRKDNPKPTGKERAQMMAAKRIAAGKTIQDVKDANTDAMKEKAAARFAEFKAKRLARMNKEEFSSYDIVLEYLLSSKQAATIEEANYIMTEMDAKTIQSIVSE